MKVEAAEGSSGKIPEDREARDSPESAPGEPRVPGQSPRLWKFSSRCDVPKMDSFIVSLLVSNIQCHLFWCKKGVGKTIYALGLKWIKKQFLIFCPVKCFIEHVCVSSAADS